MTNEERSNKLTNEGTQLLGLGDPQLLPIETLERARELFETAYELLPDCWYTLDNLGNIRDEVSLAHGGPFVSMDLFERSLELRITPSALMNKARILDVQESRHAEALKYYKKAVIQQGYMRAAYGMGVCTLMQACATDSPDLWREGWYWFEYRKGIVETFQHPLRWRGEPLRGKRLLVYLDFGIGDRIWAMRWLKKAKEQGATVFVIVEPDTMRLCCEQPYIDEVHAPGDGCALDVDYMTFATSMVGYMDPECRHRTEAPYLRAPVNTPSPESRKLRVGLCWHGSTERGYPAWRNVPFGLLSQCLPKRDEVQYVSLQKGLGEIIAAHNSPIDWQSIKACKDVYDTACLIRSCDLVITIGSMISMLAPALGVRTWVMNTYNSAWQFGPAPDYHPLGHTLLGLDSHDPNWFLPSLVRQFRQTSDRSWDCVLKNVATRLGVWIQAQRTGAEAA